jgi:hypothetical protein
MGAPQSSRDRLHEMLDTHAEFMRIEHDRAGQIDAKIKAAEEVLRGLQKELADCQRRQATIAHSIALYEEYLRADEVNQVVPPASPSEAVEPARQNPARLGGQHYLMLEALRSFGFMTSDQIAVHCAVSMQRVRKQMSLDFSKGLVEEKPPHWGLTGAGENLLRRYEEYRRNNDLPLPSAKTLSGGMEERSDENDNQEEISK